MDQEEAKRKVADWLEDTTASPGEPRELRIVSLVRAQEGWSGTTAELAEAAEIPALQVPQAMEEAKPHLAIAGYEVERDGETWTVRSSQ